MLRYDDLAIFIAVVERGSLVAAAEKIQIPSSTLSRRLSRLEADLQVRLLERTSRKIHLTEQGKTLYQQCSPLIKQLKENVTTLLESNNQAHGKLKITAPTYIGNTMIADFFMSFLRQNPEIDMEIILSNEVKDIIDEEIDIAIRVGPLVDSNFIAQHLWDFDYVLCASPDYLREQGEPKTLYDLVEYQAIVLRTQSFPWRFRLEGETSDIVIAPKSRLLLDDFHLALQAVNQGVGIARLPRSIAHKKIQSGELVHLLTNYNLMDSRTAYAVYPEKRYLPLKTRLFIDYIKQKTAQLATT